MAQPKSFEKLSKFLCYVLGYNPYEFGLVPDPDGFVKIKELLKAVCEEDGWRHVRRSHIHEVMITASHPPIEIRENLIRCIDRNNLPQHIPAQHPPKLLYTFLRNRAYPFALEKGITPGGYRQVILSSGYEMAERIGKRMDPSPVVVTVNVPQAVDAGVVFYQAGDSIHLCDFIPPGCFSGPPLPKQKPETRKPEVPEPPKIPKAPGSFVIDLDPEKDQKKNFKQKGKRKVIAWKEDLRRMKRQKRKKNSF
jgi:putative RNA 2'-phosphotransferase